MEKYKFESNFLLEQAKVIRAAVNLPLVYLGGLDSRQGIVEILEAGFDVIALGRPLIHDVSFLLKIKERQVEKSACTRCNQCIVEMHRDGLRCVWTQSP